MIESRLTLAAAQPDSSARNGLLTWADALSSGAVRALTISYFCYGYVAWIFFSWFFTYISKVRGLNLRASALYSMLPFLAMLAGCLLGGLINDRITKTRGARLGRCGVAVVAICLAGIFIACGTQVQSVRMASFVLAGGAGALYLSQSSFWSVTADIAGSSSGSISGVMNTGNQVGAALTAALTPWIAERFGWSTSFLVAAALCVIGAGSWLFVDPSRKLSQAQVENIEVGLPAE
jgi:ACS family glucarate transporter-like MFS transporter